jgi:carboxypeptidase C (cathepsin A)
MLHWRSSTPARTHFRASALRICAALLLVFAGPLAGDAEAQVNAWAVADPAEHPNRAVLPLDSVVVTENTVTVNGEVIPYRATTGTMPVFDAEGRAVAALFYVYYQRTDVDDTEDRPLTFSFNGGPGSSSVWMHLGYTGPRQLNIDDEGFPVRPFGVRENPHSILDATDIVFVDPVNVGLSRMVEGADRSQFFGVNADVNYLAAWIELFVNRHDRWLSPIFLIGESYGTTRVAGLSSRLQRAHKLFVNGVVLVSPTGLGHDFRLPSAARTLPHYAATAWYFGKLPPELQARDLDQVLAEVETFAIEEYPAALARGGALPAAERQAMARRVAGYAGVSPEYVDNLNLEIPIGHWRKELLRDDRLTVGRLDSRYQGVDRDAAGTSYDYDPAMSSWNHSFTPAMKSYLRNDLGYETDLEYVTIGGSVNPWDRSGDTTGDDLRGAMSENPWMKTMIQAGFYDGATDYFSAKLLIGGLDRSGQLQDRFRFRTYRSGHMMYLRSEDLATSNQDIREFIEWSVPADGVPAQWGRRTPVSAGGEEG